MVKVGAELLALGLLTYMVAKKIWHTFLYAL